MKTRLTVPSDATPIPVGFPDADALAALRAWYAGVPARDAVVRYLHSTVTQGQSARGVIGRIRRQLIDLARNRHREDLAALFEHSATTRVERGKAVSHAIDVLRSLPAPESQISDDVALWFFSRTLNALHAHGIQTLADLTVRIPRRRQWWKAVPGLGPASARRIEAFFATHPALTERARALITIADRGVVVPWESLRLPHEVDGSQGAFRAPRQTCSLDANNDYEAVQAWLSLHESTATQRAYRKEAERLILWAIVERERALSSLTTEDAIAYRSFLRRPTPRERWVGPPRSRDSVEWRPFTGGLSARSVAYALSVLGAMCRRNDNSPFGRKCYCCVSLRSAGACTDGQSIIDAVHLPLPAGVLPTNRDCQPSHVPSWWRVPRPAFRYRNSRARGTCRKPDRPQGHRPLRAEGWRQTSRLVTDVQMGRLNNRCSGENVYYFA